MVLNFFLKLAVVNNKYDKHWQEKNKAAELSKWTHCLTTEKRQNWSTATKSMKTFAPVQL